MYNYYNARFQKLHGIQYDRKPTDFALYELNNTMDICYKKIDQSQHFIYEYATLLTWHENEYRDFFILAH